MFEPGLPAGEMATEDAELLCDKNCGWGVTGEFMVVAKYLELEGFALA